MKHKKLLIVVGVVVLVLVAAAIGNHWDSKKPVPTASPTPSQMVGDSSSDISLKYGDLLEIADNRETDGIVVIKAKISANSTNALTVAQNYHNVVDLIQNHGFDDCELQYWAVSDMSDGTEGKVISFTVPADVVLSVASGDIVATTLPDRVSDLWILPSLSS